MIRCHHKLTGDEEISTLNEITSGVGGGLAPDGKHFYLLYTMEGKKSLCADGVDGYKAIWAPESALEIAFSSSLLEHEEKGCRLAFQAHVRGVTRYESRRVACQMK